MIEKIEWQSLKDRLITTIIANLNKLVFFLVLGLLAFFFLVNWYFIRILSHHYEGVIDQEARLFAVTITDNLRVSELNWAFAEILRKSSFPIIITDPYGNPKNWKNISPGLFRKFQAENFQTSPFYQLPQTDQELLRKIVKNLGKRKQPLPIIHDGITTGYLYYGNVYLLKILKWLPLFEVSFLILFVIIAMYGFQMLRQTEQGLLWVALAKETAHQMGTPLSSILGWLDLLKLRLEQNPGNEKSLDTVNEIAGDVARLNQVSVRFSQIGSLPKLTSQDLNSLVISMTDYFKSRLPQLGKKVELQAYTPPLPHVYFNRELMGWVLENLIKNALDSITSKNGFIKVETFYAKAEDTVHITITDNGRGIERENWKKIFKTGYSTKKRGWGLGLSLARRIITIYHQGSIFVEWSSKYHGTQFRIILPVFPERAKRAEIEKLEKSKI